MSAATSEKPVPGVFEAITPFLEDTELWCHRTLISEVSVFWEGLRIPSIQAGLRSTSTRLSDKDTFPSLEDAVEEFTTRWIPEDPRNNARVFVVAPVEHRDLLIPQLHLRPLPYQRGLLPGRFVLAHLSLLNHELNLNPAFDPSTTPE